MYISFLLCQWYDISQDTATRLRLIQIDDREDIPSGFDPITKTMSLIIGKDRKWHLYVLGYEVTHKNCPALQSIPTQLDINSAEGFLASIDNYKVCPGNPRREHVDIVKAKHGYIINTRGEKTAQLDSNGRTETVRHKDCHRLILPNEVRCMKCRFSLKMLCMRLARAKGSVYIHLIHALQCTNFTKT